MQSKCEISLPTPNLTFTMLLELVYKFKFNFNPNSNPEVLEDLNCSQVFRTKEFLEGMTIYSTLRSVHPSGVRFKYSCSYAPDHGHKCDVKKHPSAVSHKDLLLVKCLRTIVPPVPLEPSEQFWSLF